MLGIAFAYDRQGSRIPSGETHELYMYKCSAEAQPHSHSLAHGLMVPFFAVHQSTAVPK
jgi:hypothetical protein